MDTKICILCNKEKELESYRVVRRKTTLYPYAYVSKYCSECRKKKKADKQKNDRLNDPERFKRYSITSNARIKSDPERESNRKRVARIWATKNIQTFLFNSAKFHAKTKGYEFTIQKSDILVPDVCPILKINLYKGTKLNLSNSFSIDRIDNSKGYVPGNVAVISRLANMMKNSSTYEQMQTFVHNILTYMKPKPESPKTELPPETLNHDQEASPPANVQLEC